MALTGWTRLWIVGSAIWWALGATWLVQNFEPRSVEEWGDIEVTTLTADPPQAVPGLTDSEIAELKEWVANRDLARRAEVEAADERGEISALEKMKRLTDVGTPPPEARVISRDRHTYFRDDWTPWLAALALVIVAPFGGALAFVALRALGLWVWRGFRPMKS